MPYLLLMPAYRTLLPYLMALCAHLQNELAMLEFIHCFVEVLDKHFGQVRT